MNQEPTKRNPWIAASNGGKFYVMKERGPMLNDRRGYRRRYKSLAAAQRMADRLNREEPTP